MPVKHSAWCLAHGNHPVSVSCYYSVALTIIVDVVLIISSSHTFDFARLQGSTASLAVLAGHTMPIHKTNREIFHILLLTFC